MLAAGRAEDDPCWHLYPSNVSAEEGELLFSDKNWEIVKEKSWLLVFKGQHAAKDDSSFDGCLEAFSKLYNIAMNRVSHGPLKVMETALESMDVMKAMAEIGLQASASDAGVGALCARAAVM